MECNKEEAVRAKAIAEKKMQCRDFIGARKMVLKAQQLFPDLENVSQMLTVCQVHCSAETKVIGSEDWYGILQVEPTADESLIKKQYRKLALLLHPDKNKFAGAEAAFKLVGEAHRTLSDKSKRSVYDLKRSAGVKTVVFSTQARQQGKASDTRGQPPAPSSYPNHGSSFTNVNQTQAAHQQQTQAAFGSLTFWTICPSCGIRYQYYRTIVNKALRCQNCLKPFIAHDINVQGVPGAVNFSCPVNKPGFSHQNDYQGNDSKTSRQPSKSEGPGGRSVLQPDTKIFGPGCSQKTKQFDEVENGNAMKKKVKIEEVNLAKPNQTEPNMQPSGNANQKRGRKMVVESSDSDSTDSEATMKESEPDVVKNEGTSGNHRPRRSSRHKPNVSYTEDNSDGDDSKKSTGFKRLRKNSSPHSDDQRTKPSSGVGVDKVEEPMDAAPASLNKSVSTKEGTLAGDGSPAKNNCEETSLKESGDRKCQDKVKAIPEDGMSAMSSSNMNERKINTTFLDYPDPEFYDFDNDRSPKCFAVGQIWSLYDYVDGMPRFYALIRNISSSGFKLRFTWLEHFPIGQAEKDWSDEELPVGCGVFRLGRTETTEDSRVFSHLMPWNKGPKRNPYLIYPRKGEVWALFKGWDLNWSVDPDQHRQYDYELVEVLSDFAADTGADVVSLVKVKGFVSIFCQAGGGRQSPAHIPHDELLRFSHMVPSYRMTGKEREGIPEGFFELDSASLPINVEQTSPSVALHEVSPSIQDPCQENCAAHSDDQAGGSKVNDRQADKGVPSSSVDPVEQNGNGSPPDLQSPTYIVYQDSEFYDFDLDRVKEKFLAGQIWALYCEDDGFPKYYGYVRKVDPEDFKVHLTWLEACPRSEQEAKWSVNGLPFGCGRFKPISGKEGKETYRVIETFSHLVQQTEPSQRRLQYDIYPQVNEVWAVFRNWSVDWSLSDLEKCSEKGEYDLLEVTAASSSAISGQVLEKVEGFKTLFKPRMRSRERVKVEISCHELLRFSHRIPSFRLTEERGGKLRGFLELDPASVPDLILCSS